MRLRRLAPRAPALSVVENHDAAVQVALAGQGVDEDRHRLPFGLFPVGERAEVHRDHRLGAEVVHRRERVHRPDVLHALVPLGHEAADGKQRDLEVRKALSDLFEVAPPTGVPGEIDRARGPAHDEAAPEHRVAVEEAAIGMVPGGNGRDRDARSDLRGLPPVEIVASSDALALEKDAAPHSDEDGRLIVLPQSAQRRDVHVVVVIVRDNDGVDPRQILEADPGGTAPLHAHGRHRARGPGRVGQDVDPVHLDQERRVVDERHRDLTVADTPGGRRAEGSVGEIGPGTTLRCPVPLRPGPHLVDDGLRLIEARPVEGRGVVALGRRSGWRRGGGTRRSDQPECHRGHAGNLPKLSEQGHWVLWFGKGTKVTKGWL